MQLSTNRAIRSLLALMLLAAILLGSLIPAQAAPSAAPTGQRLRNLAGSFLMFLAFLTVIGVLISDLALAVLDPRIRLQGSARK